MRYGEGKSPSSSKSSFRRSLKRHFRQFLAMTQDLDVADLPTIMPVMARLSLAQALPAMWRKTTTCLHYRRVFRQRVFD